LEFILLQLFLGIGYCELLVWAGLEVQSS
jgi:hypothetical protein